VQNTAPWTTARNGAVERTTFTSCENIRLSRSGMVSESLTRIEVRGTMLTTDTFEKALDLLELGYTFPAITEETGITTEDAEAVHIAWFNGTGEQLFRELQLAGVLELAAARLRSGQGWDEATASDLLGEILHVYSAHVKKALAMVLLSGKF
jgi:hypothetical protein